DIGTWRQYIYGFYTAPDGYFYIFGGYHGYDDDTGTDGSNQRLISRLYGLNMGIQEQHDGQVAPLQIAPNPSAGQTVLSVGTPPQKGTLTIHDASGRVVWQEPWPAGAYTHTLRAGASAPGTYVVRVVSSDAATAGSAARDPAGGYVGQLVVLP
ncbi:MAG TPA: T9SS type A sorting domain-containing protein, partial [Flavobacteriales bacterium]|nr:T9SS type A sorting domain-containing protein [Flavobacteriales bacterium]